MKKRALIFSLLIVVFLGCIFYFYAFSRIQKEKTNLYNDLFYRSNIQAETIIDKFFEKDTDPGYFEQALEKISRYEKIVDTAYYDNSGTLIYYKRDSSLDAGIAAPTDGSVITRASEFPFAEFKKGYARFYYSMPDKTDGDIIGYLSITQDTRHIEGYAFRAWRDRILTFFILIAGLFSFAYLMFYLYVIRSSALAVDLLKKIRKSVDSPIDLPNDIFPFSDELNKEVAITVQSFLRARQSAREEADLRYKIIDSTWTFSRLQRFFSSRLEGRKVVNVSNREPYVHNEVGGKTKVFQPAHGLISSLDEMMKACGGTWVAHGAGNKDRAVVDQSDKIFVPPEEPAYFLKRVWLTPDEVKGHYVGFSNEALYPLCLMTHNRPIFRNSDWEHYKTVNEKFASAVLDEIEYEKNPIIFIHDLHFTILPKLIKEKRPDADIILFWHHPWPSAEQFSILPWKKEILEGLLSADVLCFHVHHFCNNFTDTVKKELEAKIDTENSAVYFNGKETLVKHFPISIPFTNLHSATLHDPDKVKTIVGEDIDDLRVILGVDRMDYTKGLIERLKGIEQFYDTYPEFKKNSVFVQVAAPSREAVPKYQQYAKQVLSEVERINNKLQTNTWKPILFLHKQVKQEDLVYLYRKAEVCLVTSLHDGMNLVAKEYVAQHKDKGVLILSEFTGAARELHSALKINPYSAGDIVNALNQAFTMEHSERKARLEAMRNKIVQYNIFRWAADIFDSLFSK
ncbi:MAG: trehalose-6-phosphate synthase [Candidatus Paceibacterota bacterium]|jgi:trehalose 6-phosphate synthase|nr:trehalose-6-phosphate synthase [Candidatus Paceibacterota bacterium]